MSELKQDPQLTGSRRLHYKMGTRQEEGFRKKIYTDPSDKGNKAVGTGFNLDDPVTAAMVPKEVREGKRGITRAEDAVTYKNRMDLAKKDAASYLGSKTYKALDQDRKDVINDMSYNMGLPSLSSFSDLKAAIIAKDYDTAAKEILDSDYARKDVPARAKRNAEKMRGKERELETEILRQAIE